VVDAARGLLVAVGDGLGLVTTDGILELVEVQPAGGRRMRGSEYARGRPGLIGSRVREGTVG
jgi:methionyl-tRNA formyltransferase